jgi:hypothetical protein
MDKTITVPLTMNLEAVVSVKVSGIKSKKIGVFLIGKIAKAFNMDMEIDVSVKEVK